MYYNQTDYTRSNCNINFSAIAQTEIMKSIIQQYSRSAFVPRSVPELSMGVMLKANSGTESSTSCSNLQGICRESSLLHYVEKAQDTLYSLPRDKTTLPPLSLWAHITP